MGLGLWILLLAIKLDVIFAQGHYSKPGRMIIYLEDEKPIIIPKQRPLGPLGYKFYNIHPSKVNKKSPLKYVNHTPVGEIKLVSGLEDIDYELKKCCGNEWTGDDQEVLQYVVHVPLSHISHVQGYHQQEDIKPVTEHIEDDIKYDFRTKMHSID